MQRGTMIKKSMIVLWMTFLVSCIYITPKPVYEVSFEFNRCRQMCFDFNTMKKTEDSRCGTSFVSGNYALQKCDGLVGVSIRDYASYLKPKVKENIEYCNDLSDYP